MIIRLFVVTFLPLFGIAQQPATACKLLRDTDPYTKQTKLSTGFISLQSGTSVAVDADSKEIDFFFTIPDECYNDMSTVAIYFEGSKIKTTYRNSGSMNCEGGFHFLFRNGPVTPSVLQKLATQKVSSFVFTGNDKKKPVTVGLLPDQQQSLMDAIACMATEAKSLIKN